MGYLHIRCDRDQFKEIECDSYQVETSYQYQQKHTFNQLSLESLISELTVIVPNACLQMGNNGESNSGNEDDEGQQNNVLSESEHVHVAISDISQQKINHSKDSNAEDS